MPITFKGSESNGEGEFELSPCSLVKPSKSDDKPKDNDPIINEPKIPGIILLGSPSYARNFEKPDTKVVTIKTTPAVRIKHENKGII